MKRWRGEGRGVRVIELPRTSHAQPRRAERSSDRGERSAADAPAWGQGPRPWSLGGLAASREAVARLRGRAAVDHLVE
eukprot:1603538-Prymnesium_polylepis.1